MVRQPFLESVFDLYGQEREDLAPRVKIQCFLFELCNGLRKSFMFCSMDQDAGIVVQPHVPLFGAEMLFNEGIKVPKGLHELIPAADALDQSPAEPHRVHEKRLMLVIQFANTQVQFVQQCLVNYNVRHTLIPVTPVISYAGVIRSHEGKEAPRLNGASEIIRIHAPYGFTTNHTSLTPWPFVSPGALSPAKK